MEDFRPKMIVWLSWVRDQGEPCSFTQMLAALSVDSQDRRKHFCVYRQLTGLDVERFGRGLHLLSIWVGYKGKRAKFVPKGHERLLERLHLLPQGKTAAEVREELRQRSRRRIAA